MRGWSSAAQSELGNMDISYAIRCMNLEGRSETALGRHVEHTGVSLSKSGFMSKIHVVSPGGERGSRQQQVIKLMQREIGAKIRTRSATGWLHGE